MCWELMPNAFDWTATIQSYLENTEDLDYCLYTEKVWQFVTGRGVVKSMWHHTYKFFYHTYETWNLKWCLTFCCNRCVATEEGTDKNTYHLSLIMESSRTKPFRQKTPRQTPQTKPLRAIEREFVQGAFVQVFCTRSDAVVFKTSQMTSSGLLSTVALLWLKWTMTAALLPTAEEVKNGQMDRAYRWPYTGFLITRYWFTSKNNYCPSDL